MKIIENWILVTVCLVCIPSQILSSKRCYYSDGLVEGYCLEQWYSVPGMVRFAAMVGVHHPRDDHSCGDISLSGVQTTMAVKWIVDILNGAGDFEKAFIQGIKLGFDVYDDCGIKSRATDGVSELVPRTDSAAVMNCNVTGCNGTDRHFLGFLSSSTTEATSAALSVLSPAITGMTSLSSYFDEANERRLTFSSSEDAQIMGTVKWMSSLNWNLIAVVYTDDARSTSMYNSLVKYSKTSKICLALVSQIKRKELTASTQSQHLEDIIKALEMKQQQLTDEKLSVVFLGNLNTAKLLFHYIKNRKNNVVVHKLQWILQPNIHLDYSLRNTLKTQGDKTMPKVIVVEKQHRLLTSFKDFFIQELKNFNSYTSFPRPYLEGYKSQMIGPNSVGSESELTKVYRQTESVLPTVVAILSMASSLRQLQMKQCGSTNLCAKLQANLDEEFLRFNLSTMEQDIQSFSKLPDELKNLTLHLMNNNYTYSFPTSNDLQFSLFDASDETFLKLSSLENGEIVVHNQTQLQLLTSDCKTQCPECWNNDIQFAYIPGDVLLLGIFSLREDGSTSSDDSSNKYNCGAFRDSYTPMTVASFLNSITTLQQQSVAGPKIGGIALDDCYNPLSMSYLLSELFTGKRTLLDPNTGESVDFSKVIAVIGALSSSVTQVIADQLTLLDIPLISYGASSASLDNKIRYPLFLRTVPSDDFQVQGFVDILEKLKISHVGIIYLDDAYGQNAKQSFLSMTEHKKICVEQPLPITEDFTNDQIQKIIEKLKEQRVKIVLFIGIDTVVEKLLEGLMTKIAEVHFTFLASEGWGTHTSLIDEDRGKAAAGTLVFVTDDSSYVDGSFKLYLENLTITSTHGNPWLKQFLENVMECDFHGSYNKRYSKSCSDKAKFSKDQIETYASFQRSVHVHHATYAVEKAYRQVMDDKSCQPFRKRECADVFVAKIKATELTSQTGQRIQVFKDDGNGFMGFNIYNIQTDVQNKYKYVKVGSYSSSTGELLQLNKNITIYKEGNPPIPISLQELKATCEEVRTLRDKCNAICPKTTTPATTTMAPTSSTDKTTSEEFSVLNIVLAIVCGVLLLFLILLALMMCRQQKMTSALHNTELKVRQASIRSLEIYDEPYRERRIRTTSFEQSEHVTSSTSGVVSLRSSNQGGNRNLSNGTTKSLKSPIKYSDVLQLEVPNTQGLMYGSRASMATYLDPSDNKDVPNIEITRDDSILRDFRPSDREQIQRRRSLDNLQEPNLNLNYIQAKDLEMEDEDELVQQQADINYRQRAISLNDNVVGQPNLFMQRPNTLPGIPSRSVSGNRDNLHTPSYPAPTPTRHMQPTYLDVIHDAQIHDPSMYPNLPLQMNTSPQGSQLLMVAPGTYIPSLGYQGIPSSAYQQMYIPSHSNVGYIPSMAFVNSPDDGRPRGSSFTSGVPQHSMAPQIHFVDPHHFQGNPNSVHGVSVHNNGQSEFVSNTLPLTKHKSKEQREQYHSMTSMPDVISHENDDGTEIMI